jgi:hypothetical protein
LVLGICGCTLIGDLVTLISGFFVGCGGRW